MNEADDYIIATGKTISLDEFVRLPLEKLGLDWKNYVLQWEELMKPTDLSISKVDPRKAFEKLGCRVKITFDQLVEKMNETEN